MSLESATHIAFPFLNSFPLSNHISGVPGCFLNFVQIWIRFGILPEIKSNLALKLAVVHFAAHVWITNFLVKRTLWYSPTKKKHLLSCFQNLEKRFGLQEFSNFACSCFKKTRFWFGSLHFSVCCLGFAGNLIFVPVFLFVIIWSAFSKIWRNGLASQIFLKLACFFQMSFLSVWSPSFFVFCLGFVKKSIVGLLLIFFNHLVSFFRNLEKRFGLPDFLNFASVLQNIWFLPWNSFLIWFSRL